MKFMQIKPQKARGVLKESYWINPEWVAEEKYDGDRRIAQFLEGVRFTGTRESVDGSGYVEKTNNLPHLSPKVARLDLRTLRGTVLDGEIVAPWAKDLPGGKSKYVTSIMGSDPERAIMLQKQHGWLEYMVFDCLWYKGKDVRHDPLPTRRQAAANAIEQWNNPCAKLVTQIANNTKPLFFDRILKRGGEGVILKHLEHTYGDEKLWVKVKGEWTADVVIDGFKPGKGKYAGSVGAVYVAQYREMSLRPGALNTVGLWRCGSVRGFSDSVMREFADKPRGSLGRVIEIMHNGREPTGAFRHPRFKRFRPDKSPKDCVYREDEI